MIRRYGPQRWRNIHLTHSADVTDLIDVDASILDGERTEGMATLRAAAADFESLVKEARTRGLGLRGLGSGWALTDIAVTDGLLVNTKLLNGCFDIAPRLFDATYATAKQPYLVVAQCGMSVGELNVHLEVTAVPGFRRCLKTAGIGAGQTIAGAVSGNTHGSAINFGSTPDFVVGMQIITGSGQSIWLERQSHPVLNEEFAADLGAILMRDDEVFDAALVSFGAFGVIAAMAIETDPAYELVFPEVASVYHDSLTEKLDNLATWNTPDLYHYEFVFDPYSMDTMEAAARRVVYVEPGHPSPKPVWILRSGSGFAPGDEMGGSLFSLPVAPGKLTKLQFKQYRELAMLSSTQGTPGQLFTATITYLEGYTESAIAVSIDDAAKMVATCSAVIRACRVPSIAQVRVVHPTKATLGFTHFGPKTAVFEFALPNDKRFAEFEDKLTQALEAEGVRYAFHWSKNSGIDPERLVKMYGTGKVARWRAARERLFDGDTARIRVFDNTHVIRAGLNA